MATLEKNSLFAGLSGRVGNLVFRQVNGKTVVAKCPSRKQRWSPNQEKRRERFGLAAAYAHTQMHNATTRDEYATGITDKKTSAYMVALTDYMTPPQIHALDIGPNRGKGGSTIRIKAIDDFKVVSVEVKIINPAGVLIECGNALQQSKILWKYRASQVESLRPGNKVVVTASDKPGNHTTMEKVIE